MTTSVQQPPRPNRLAAARTGAKLVGRIYRDRVGMAYAARVLQEPLAQLSLPGVQADPYPVYDAIRARGPLSRTRLGNWVSASHAVCTEVVRSRHCGVLPNQPGEDDQVSREMLDLSLLELNPPEHTRLRRLVAPAFSPRRMAAYEPLVEQRVAALLAGVPRDGFDLVRDFASPLPIAVITELLGVPDVDAAAFARYGATVGSALDGIKSVGHLRQLVAAQRELRRIFTDLFALRRVEPRDDLVSALVVEANDEVTPEVLGPLCRLLLVAGFETTVNAIGNGVRALLANPEQWALLVADPSQAAAVVEEVLRYDPPVQLTARVVRNDLELAGTPVRAGEWVITLLAGANRDPAAYPDPNRFEITRTPAVEQLAFSGGVHYCLGAPLARLELTAAFRALAERMPRLRLAGPVPMRRATTLHGPVRLPVAA